MSDLSLNEFWQVEGQELEKERKRKKKGNGEILFQDDGKIEIDSKLEQYLSIHSMNLSSSVRNYVEK